MVSYIEDPLLLKEKKRENFVNVNSLINTNFPYTLQGSTLNLYTVLVKSIDFNRSLNSMVYCKIPTKRLCKNLDNELIKNNFIGLRKEVARYCLRKKLKIECMRKWEKDNIWPFFVLRAISLTHKNDLKVLSTLIRDVEYFTDVHNRNRFYPAREIEGILNEKSAYLAGCVLGDGGFSLSNFWVIVDGSKEEERIIDSIAFLDKIKRLIEELFGLRINKLTRRDNRIELIINNLVFSRFINFYFGAPYGKKKDKIEKPKIFLISKKASLLYKYFWRGLFDTDGYCQLEGKQISLSSGTKKLLDECKKDLGDIGVSANVKFGTQGSYFLNVYSDDYKKFSYEIGFSHPRKQKALIRNLKIGAGVNEYKDVIYNNLYKGTYVDLRKIARLRIYNAGEYIQHIRAELKLRQKDMAKNLGTRLNNLSRWELNNDGIFFEDFYNILKLGGKDYDYFLKRIYDNVLFNVGKKSTLIKLPKIINNDTKNLAKVVIPYGSELRIKKRRGGNSRLHKLRSIIKEKYDLDIVETQKNVHSILNKTLSYFFKNYFIYEKSWKPISIKEEKNLVKSLNSIWD